MALVDRKSVTVRVDESAGGASIATAVATAATEAHTESSISRPCEDTEEEGQVGEENKTSIHQA
jgi:hypothetical protein